MPGMNGGMPIGGRMPGGMPGPPICGGAEICAQARGSELRAGPKNAASSQGDAEQRAARCVRPLRQQAAACLFAGVGLGACALSAPAGASPPLQAHRGRAQGQRDPRAPGQARARARRGLPPCRCQDPPAWGTGRVVRALRTALTLELTCVSGSVAPAPSAKARVAGCDACPADARAQWLCTLVREDAQAGHRSPGSHRSYVALAAAVVRRRRALNGQADHLLAADENQAKRPPNLAVSLGHTLLGRQATKLLRVAQHDVHVPVEGHEAAHQVTAVQDGDAHPAGERRREREGHQSADA